MVVLNGLVHVQFPLCGHLILSQTLSHLYPDTFHCQFEG